MASGRSRNYLVDIVVVLVLVALAYVGYKFIPAYLDHYRLKNNVRDVIVATTRTTKGLSLKKELRVVAREYEIDLAEDDILVNFGNQEVKVHFEYDRLIPIPLSDKVITLHFTVDDMKDLRIF